MTNTTSRQSGKTEELINHMVRHARDGLKVAYVSRLMVEVTEVQRRIEALSEPDIEKSYRSNGNEHIRFKSGGSIRFLTNARKQGRGLTLDVLAWDGSEEPSADILCALMGSPHAHIYR